MTVPSVPNYVYRDTSLVIATIVPGLPHARASDAFCTQLAHQGSRIGFSQILRLELSRAIRNLASRRGQLPLNTQQSYRLDEWDTNVAVRQRWMTAGRQKFEAFLDRFDGVAELPFHTAIWEQSVAIMALRQLRSLDAVHVATAHAYGLRHFATLDDDFNRVQNLHIWLIRDGMA